MKTILNYLTNRRLATLLLTLLLSTATGTARTAPDESAAERGRKVAEEADRRDLGFVNFKVNITMTLRNRHGEESSRRLRNHVLEMAGDGDRSLIVFDEPRDVKGTVFLSHTHATGPDDQWLYLPSLKRVKRIASNNKSGPFMGSEFAYEDISSPEVAKYTYGYRGEESLEGHPTYVVERYPVDARSGYTKQVVWYDTERLIPLRIDFFDRKGELLKTLTYHEYARYLDRYWRAARLEMVNHQTGKSTTLRFDDYQFQTDLQARDFEQASLSRLR